MWLGRKVQKLNTMIHKPTKESEESDRLGCGCICSLLFAGIIPGIILIIADIIGDINNPSALFKGVVISTYIIGFIVYFIFYLKNN